MNSKAVGETINTALHIRVPRWIPLVAVVYVALLVAIGIAVGDNYSFDAFAVAGIPAVIYILGAFRYRRALFTEAEPAQRAQAWWRPVRLSAFLFTAWLTLYQILGFSSDSDEIRYGIPGQIWWTVVTAVLVELILLSACVSRRVLLQPRNPDAGGRKLSLTLLAGSAMVFAIRPPASERLSP